MRSNSVISVCSDFIGGAKLRKERFLRQREGMFDAIEDRDVGGDDVGKLFEVTRIRQKSKFMRWRRFAGNPMIERFSRQRLLTTEIEIGTV
jgi:hypothetical protein